MDDPRPVRRPFLRRLARRLLALAGLLLLGFAGLPWLAGLDSVRSVLLAHINRTYSPTVIQVSSVSVSWIRPVQLTGVVLKDKQGKAVVRAPAATLNRNLAQLLLARPNYGVLTLHHAEVDIQRHPDGRIDLAEALAPLLASDPNQPADPQTNFTLKIIEGTLVLRYPELLEPVLSRRLDLTLHAAPSPNPLSWDIHLTGAGIAADPASPPETLHITGTFDHRKISSPLQLTIKGDRWPIAAGLAGVEARGRLLGTLTVQQEADQPYRLAGDLQLMDSSASGPTLRGDHPSLGDLAASFLLDYGPSGLSVDSLRLSAPFGHLQATPSADPNLASRYVGQVDLPSLARLFPKTLRLREGLSIERGTLALDVSQTSPDPSSRRLELSAELLDLAARDANRTFALTQPMSVKARINQQAEKFAVEHASIQTPFLQAQGQGDLDLGISLSGSADLAALEQQARQFLDLGSISLAGQARFGGDLKRDPKAPQTTFLARLAVEAANLHLDGLTSQPLHLPSSRADLVLQGPIADSGTPSDWSHAWLTLKSGSLTAQAHAADSTPGLSLSLRLNRPISTLSSLIGSPLDDPTSLVLAVDGLYQQASDRLQLSRIQLDSSYGSLQGRGALAELSSRLTADLAGTLSPNYLTIQQVASAALGTPIELTGLPLPFHLRGPLRADSLNTLVRQLDAQAGLELQGASMAGLQMGPARLLLQCANGQVFIPPIQTTLNGGSVSLRPGLELRPDGSAILLLGEGTSIDRAEINPTLSRQLLSYIAPVLHEATQVRGHVSARFHHAAIAVAGPGAGAPSTNLAAQVEFHNVTYGPGPLAQQILLLGGLPTVPSLVINQPVDVVVSSGRVEQSGLAVQVAPDIQFRLEGSVGLDSTLALRAGVPLSARMLGRQDLVNDIVGGTLVAVPIGGTLARPALDRAAFQLALRQSTRQILDRAATRGASELLRGLIGDDSPPASPAPDAPPSTGPKAIEDIGRGLLRQFLPGAGGPPPVAPGPTPLPGGQ